MSRLTFVALVLHINAAFSLAADDPVLRGSIDKISSETWSVSGLSSTLEYTEAGLRGDFAIARIAILESGRTFEDIRVSCGLISLTSRSVRCGNGMFTATAPGIGRQTVPGTFVYDRKTGSTNIELLSVEVANAEVRFEIDVSDEGVDVRFEGTQLELDALLVLANQLNDAFSEYSASGLADISGTLSTPADGLLHVVLAAELDAASLANNAGTIAADGVGALLNIDMTLDANRSVIKMQFRSHQGEAYLEPVYANFGEQALTLEADKVVTSNFLRFEVGEFRLQQDTLLDVGGSGILRFPEEEGTSTKLTADVELRASSVTNLYDNLLRIQVAGTVLGDLETDGNLSGLLSITDNAVRKATLQLDDVILDDRRGRFSVYGLQGQIDWRADESKIPNASEIRWASGTVYNIPVSGGEMRVQLGDNDIQLLAPLRLPTMGGALLIKQLDLQNFGGDDATGTLDAELEPIQLGQLTGAFGWPAFSGTLSGKLPLLQLAENTITVGGTLSAQIFDGAMEMSNLRVEQPFGRVPRMQGDLAFRGLDLERVTDTFSFGLIQGRLSGDIRELEMQNWRPVEMDMNFYTPVGDKSQRRISQRAVENLASVGGGGAAAILSTGFLRFFEVFSYDRIGLRCLLKDGVCAMSGAGPAKSGSQGTGFYIVKGSGLPRIDVVGYRDTVSWPRLVQQLGAITRSGSPTVN